MSSQFLTEEAALWRQAGRHKVVAVLLVCLVVLAFAGALSLTAAVNAQTIGEMINRRDHREIVAALEEQVSLIQWIGGAIITSLTAAVGLLFRALEKANAQSRQDLVEGIKRREDLVQNVVQSNTEVTTEVRAMNQDIRELISEVRAR